MVFQCVVPDCQNSSDSPGISMHQFPNDKKLRTAWTTNIFHGVKRNIRAKQVCSVHFKSGDFEFVHGEKVLKNDAKPSLFLPGSSAKSNLGKLILSEETRSEEVNFLNYDKLPDLVLIKIFSHLNFWDVFNAGLTCRRWYEVSRSLWTKIEVANFKSSRHMLEFINKLLPGTVRFLNVRCNSFDRFHSLWLPDILVTLHEGCPELNTLIIENVFFARRFCNANLTTRHVLQSDETQITETSKKRKTRYPKITRCLKECCSEQLNNERSIPENRPRELRCFSLRYAHSYLGHLSSQLSLFLPEVKVLDLTCSATVKMSSIPFFLRLTHLEELYLTECPITNFAIESLLKNLKGLKVLDLEGARVADEDTVWIIMEHGQSLEELYLGNTEVDFSCARERTLPLLRRLCLRNTPVIDFGNFTEYPLLSYLDASFCQMLMMDLCAWTLKEFYYLNDGDPEDICHHFKKKYM